MAAGTIVSRLLGFARAALLASAVGIGLAADTFQVANTLPNQFYLLLAGGVLNAVLVPQITKASTHADGGDRFVQIGQLRGVDRGAAGDRHRRAGAGGGGQRPQRVRRQPVCVVDDDHRVVGVGAGQQRLQVIDRGEDDGRHRTAGGRGDLAEPAGPPGAVDPHHHSHP